jgi:hypothetical protein
LLLDRERLIGARGQRGMIQTERMTDQHARVEFRRIDAAGAKFGGPGAPAFGNANAFDFGGSNGLSHSQASSYVSCYVSCAASCAA